MPGSVTGYEATNQRGVDRPKGKRYDIGAFEREVAAPPTPTLSPSPEPVPTVEPVPTEAAPAPQDTRVYLPLTLR